jgi:outer membrane protein
MKQILLISNGILAIAVVILYVIVLGHNSKESVKKQVSVSKSSTMVELPIAYINVDSLLMNYEFAKNANESLIRKQEASRLTINTQARQLQTEMADFQRKLENNAFLSRDRAEQEQSRLLKKQKELQELDGRLSQQLMSEQQKMSEKLRDKINTFLKEYNKENKYELILSNTSDDNILYASDIYDITAEVTQLLNENDKKK